VNKATLIQSVAKELKLSRTEAGRAVEAVVKAIAQGVGAEDKVTISGFGTFRKKHRKARVALNPLTHREMRIEAGKTIGFSASKALRDRL